MLESKAKGAMAPRRLAEKAVPGCHRGRLYFLPTAVAGTARECDLFRAGTASSADCLLRMKGSELALAQGSLLP